MPAIPPCVAVALCAGLLLACGGRVWSASELERRHPVLAAHRGHRLAELHPYVLPRGGAVWLFTCRWTTDAPIGVWVSAAFGEEERHGVRLALRAWEQAVHGVRFLAVREDEASIRVEPRDDPVERAGGLGAGRAVVDCAIDGPLPGPAAPLSEPLPAQLVSARIELARSSGTDALGRPRRHSPEEFTGAALHELGHALGFQGHAEFGSTALRRSPDRVRALGADVLEGEPFADATVAALYALPTGSVLAVRAVHAGRTDVVDRMAALAERGRLAGPFVRVGDTAGRVFWREPLAPGNEYGVAVVNLAETYRDPSRVLVLPESLTRSVLPRSRDRAR